MKRLSLCLAGVLVFAVLAVTGCSQAAPAPAPTKAPAAPAKAAEPAKAPAPAPTAAPAAAPTKAPAAAPTAAPALAKKVDYPAKGRALMIIVPYSAGGATDVQIRLLAPLLEKELGIPVEVVNVPGGGAQVGTTQLVRSKPDGYTIGYTLLPPVPTMYLDPDRKATFGRKDFLTLALHTFDPQVVGVKRDSHYQTVAEVISDAKANPKKIKASTAAVLGDGHFAILELERAANINFSIVNFDGGAPAITALLGGHVDITIQSLPNFTSQVKSGEVRIIGVMDKVESPFLPGVKTLESYGFKAYGASVKGLSAPAGLPKEVEEILSAALKKAISSAEHANKLKEVFTNVKYMDGPQFGAYWDEFEASVKPLLEIAKRQ